MDPQASAGSPRPEFEFTPEQNQIIDSLAQSMRVVALFMLFIGVLYLFALIGHVVGAFRQPALIGSALLIGLVVLIIFSMAKWTNNAALSFGKVVQTTGRDVDFLMEGLNNLRKLYSLMRTIITVYVVLVLVALVAFVILAFTMPE